MTALLLASAGVATASAEVAPLLHATGRDLEVNGVSEIPARLFSIHHGPTLTPELVAEWGLEGVRVIQHAPKGTLTESAAPFTLDCLFDRYQPAISLHDPEWEPHLTTLAQTLAQRIADAPQGTHAVEFWNEPYLNWAAKPGVNYDGLYYDATRATAGGPVHALRTGEVVPGLVWDAPRTVAYLEFPDKPDYVATRFMPPNVQPGEDYPWRGRTYHTLSRWWARDAGQPSWWSGPVNRELYLAMARPFARAFKETAPDAPLIVGWGFHLFEGNWESWNLLHRPTLDALHPWIDGYDEHHYAVNPQRVAASYEIAWAYVLGTWGRSIGFWNTEAGGIQDAERPDFIYPLPGDRKATPESESRGALTYFLRDILTLLQTVPDKAKMRCAHEPQSTPGVPAGFRLLAPLRGNLSETLSSEPDVFAIAARTENRLTVVCFNGTRQPLTRTLRVDAPKGTRLRAVQTLSVLSPDAEGEMPLQSNETALEAGITTWETALELPAGLARTFVFALEGTPEGECLSRTQLVGKEAFVSISPETSAVFRIPVNPTQVKQTTAARVRWVFSRGMVNANVRCNGVAASQVHAIPPFYEAEIPLAALQGDTATLEFETDSGSAEIGAASIVLEQAK